MQSRLIVKDYFLKAAAIGLLIASGSAALADGVTIQSFGHSALLIKGGGQSVLLNPFKAVGCAQGLNEPRINANLILASSNLADEGARVAQGPFLVQPGSYRINGLKIEGFEAPHDRLGGRRFGQATIWSWRQGGLDFAHLGGTAAPLTGENKVLLGQPDVLIIGIGGGGKVYDANEAAAITRSLQPSHVIPVQYLSAQAPSTCKLSGVQPFLNAMNEAEVQKVGDLLRLPTKLTKKTVISVMNPVK